MDEWKQWQLDAIAAINKGMEKDPLALKPAPPEPPVSAPPPASPVPEAALPERSVEIPWGPPVAVVTTGPVLTPAPEAPKKKQKWDAGNRMIRVGKWVGAPSKDAAARVAEYLTTYFRTEKVWTRREHGSYVVAVRESAENTAELEEFRFNRTMEQRFQFRETSEGLVEIELYPLI